MEGACALDPKSTLHRKHYLNSLCKQALCPLASVSGQSKQPFSCHSAARTAKDSSSTTLAHRLPSDRQFPLPAEQMPSSGPGILSILHLLSCLGCLAPLAPGQRIVICFGARAQASASTADLWLLSEGSSLNAPLAPLLIWFSFYWLALGRCMNYG